MNQFFSTLPHNIINCFKGSMLLWHLVAILLTFVLVWSGFDWRYFLSTRGPILHAYLFPAVVIGGLVPMMLPLLFIALGGIARHARLRLVGWAIGQAEVIGALVAAGYKAFTGRAHPARIPGEDLSHAFEFGFLRGGVFWGWPSSHTTIAFAIAVAVFVLVPKQRWVGYAAIAYALYIGLGVSTTIHWFSDFAAGAIIGTVVGTVVGTSFFELISSSPTQPSP